VSETIATGRRHARAAKKDLDLADQHAGDLLWLASDSMDRFVAREILLV